MVFSEDFLAKYQQLVADTKRQAREELDQYKEKLCRDIDQRAVAMLTVFLEEMELMQRAAGGGDGGAQEATIDSTDDGESNNKEKQSDDGGHRNNPVDYDPDDDIQIIGEKPAPSPPPPPSVGVKREVYDESTEEEDGETTEEEADDDDQTLDLTKQQQPPPRTSKYFANKKIRVSHVASVGDNEVFALESGGDDQQNQPPPSSNNNNSQPLSSPPPLLFFPQINLQCPESSSPAGPIIPSASDHKDFVRHVSTGTSPPSIFEEEDDEQEEEEAAANNNNGKKERFKTLALFCLIEQCHAENGLEFANKAELDRHLEAEHDLLEHRCLAPGCSQSFATGFELTKHIQAGHKKIKQWRCGICTEHKYTMKNHAAMNAHMYRFHFSGAFTCPVCNFRGNIRAVMINHYISKHQKFVCPVKGCGYSAKTKGDLAKHERSHVKNSKKNKKKKKKASRN